MSCLFVDGRFQKKSKDKMKACFRNALLHVFLLLTSIYHAEVLVSPLGTPVSVALLRRRLPFVSSSQLKTLLYEFSPENGLLRGDSLPLLNSSAVREELHLLRSEQRKLTSSTNRRESQRQVTKKVGSFQLKFNLHDLSLAEGWGPEIHLVPIQEISGAELFVNVASNEDSHKFSVTLPMTASLRPESCPQEPKILRTTSEIELKEPRLTHSVVHQSGDCKDMYTHNFEVDVTYDYAFCKKHGGVAANAEHQLRVTFESVARLFKKYTCVNIVISGYYGFCNPATDPLHLGKALANCNAAGGCSRPRKILQTLRAEWMKRGSSSWADATFFFSGDNDGTRVIGAAYVNGACSSFSFGWIENAYPGVLAHEIGHSLGAPHSTRGVMRPGLIFLEEDFLAEDSVKKITNFVDNSRHSWCLSKDSASTKSWDWSIYTGIDYKFSNKIADISFNDESGANPSDILLLLISKENNRTKLVVIAYRSLSWSTPFDPRVCPEPREISYQPQGVIVGSGLSAGKVAHNEDLIVLLVQQIKRRFIAAYRVGFNMGYRLDERSRWSAWHPVPMGLLGNFRCSAIAAGRIDSEGSVNDFIVAYVGVIANMDTIFYRCAFNLNRNIGVAEKWGASLQVPYISKTKIISIGVAIYDANEDKLVDLVLSFVNWEGGRYRHKLLVGFNLSTEGKVTGGWSEAFELPTTYKMTSAADYSGALAVATRASTRTLVSPQTMKSTSSKKSWYLQMSFNFFSRGLLQPKPVDHSAEWQTGCQQCYIGSAIHQCVRRRAACAGMGLEALNIDVVTVNSTGKQDQLQEDTGALGPPTNNTVYCAGFYALYITRDNKTCGLPVSTVSLLGAGFGELLRRDLERRDRTQKYIVRYQLVRVRWSVEGDEPAGAVGFNRAPNAAQIVITSQKQTRPLVIQNALKSLGSHNNARQIFLFNNIRKVRRGNRVYVVLINFNRNFKHLF